MPPCAQALDPDTPGRAPARISDGKGLSFSAVNNPATPAPRISAPLHSMTLSMCRVMGSPIQIHRAAIAADRYAVIDGLSAAKTAALAHREVLDEALGFFQVHSELRPHQFYRVDAAAARLGRDRFFLRLRRRLRPCHILAAVSAVDRCRGCVHAAAFCGLPTASMRSTAALARAAIA